MKEETKKSNGVWELISLLRYVWENRKIAYLLIALYLPVFAVVGMVQVYLPKAVLAELEQGETVLHFVCMLGAITVVLLVSLLAKDMIRVSLQNHNALLHRELQMSYIQKLLYTEYNYLEDKQFLEMRDQAKMVLYSLYRHPGLTSDYLGMFLVDVGKILSEFGLIVLYLTLLSRLSLIITAFIFITVVLNILMSIPAGIQNKKYLKKESKARKQEQYVTNRSGDFSMTKDIRLYQMENWLLALIQNYKKRRLHYKGVTLRNDCLWGIAGSFFIRVQNLGVYAYLIHEILVGRMMASDLVLYAGVVGTLSDTLSRLVQHIMLFHQVTISFGKVQRFLEFGNESPERGMPLKREKVRLTLENVSYRFPDGKEDLLRDINLEVTAGEKVAVVGLNGAGKTTLMKIICGLLKPTGGRVLINGQDMAQLSSDERYAWFSCVFQDISFLPLSLEENIAMCPKDRIDKARVWKCLQMAGIKEQVERTKDGLDSLLDKDINENAVDFSGGEKQKLILARALYRDTSVLILDEPTAALDPLAENEMYQKYAEFTEGKTSFFVSHRLSSTSFCDRIILLDQGRIAEMGTHGELLLQGGLYAEMFALQSHYYQIGGEEAAQ